MSHKNDLVLLPDISNCPHLRVVQLAQINTGYLSTDMAGQWLDVDRHVLCPAVLVSRYERDALAQSVVSNAVEAITSIGCAMSERPDRPTYSIGLILRNSLFMSRLTRL